MANEKMMILKMLEEGKITSAEAARLLEASDAPETAARGEIPAPPPLTPPPASPPPRADGSQYRGAPPPPAPAPASTGRNFGSLASDLGRKFESFAKDMEPRLQKLTETVAEKLMSGADRIGKSISHDAPPAGYSPPPPSGRQAAAAPAPPRAPHPAPAAGSGYEKNIELTVASGYNELNLSGINGDVRVRGYNGDKITARVSYKPKRASASIDLMKLGGKYFLKYEEDDFERVSVDAYVPERMFSVVNISGMNGNLDVSSVAAHEMYFSNANGQTTLAALAADNVKADCSTGRLTLNAINADSAIFENFNGMVDAGELDVAKLSLTNYNGGLTLLMSQFARYDEYLWSVETSNAKLTLNVPTLPDLGYHIKAHTTLGEIRLGLTGLQFLINDPALAEARSINYDRAAKKVKLAVETSNAPLMIN